MVELIKSMKYFAFSNRFFFYKIKPVQFAEICESAHPHKNESLIIPAGSVKRKLGIERKI